MKGSGSGIRGRRVLTVPTKTGDPRTKRQVTSRQLDWVTTKPTAGKAGLTPKGTDGGKRDLADKEHNQRVVALRAVQNQNRDDQLPNPLQQRVDPWRRKEKGGGVVRGRVEVREVLRFGATTFTSRSSAAHRRANKVKRGTQASQHIDNHGRLLFEFDVLSPRMALPEVA